jgi:1-acyl-sn-glycerol-3-phosphate acyltransferase
VRAKAWLRIGAVTLLVLALMPVQLLATRRGWALRRSLPVAFHRIVLRLIGVAVEVRGRPDTRRPLLIVANHVSWLDICVFGSLLGLSFVAKSEVAGWPGIGLLARLQRSVFINRRQRRATSAATAEIGGRLASGDAMLLFAEGTTSDGTRVLPFRSALLGAAKEAMEREAMGSEASAVAVQPLAIRYVRRGGLPIGRGAMPEIAWTGDMDLAPHLMTLLSGGPVDVVVAWGEPIAFTSGTDRKALARALEGSVRRLVRQAGALR